MKYSFCALNYDSQFPIFSKINVNGDDALPLYKDLKKQAPGLLGSQKIKWNFTKFLVSRGAKSIKRYAPNISPLTMHQDIENFLADKIDLIK